MEPSDKVSHDVAFKPRLLIRKLPQRRAYSETGIPTADQAIAASPSQKFSSVFELTFKIPPFTRFLEDDKLLKMTKKDDDKKFLQIDRYLIRQCWPKRVKINSLLISQASQLDTIKGHRCQNNEILKSVRVHLCWLLTL